MTDAKGVRPEDIKLDYTPEQLRDIAGQIVGKTDQGELLVELHDSEIVAAVQIQLFLASKYAYRPATHANLQSLASEAIDRFEQIGLGVVVDWVGPALRVPAEPPEIVIHNRLVPFDADRQRHDVRKGTADELWAGGN